MHREREGVAGGSVVGYGAGVGHVEVVIVEIKLRGSLGIILVFFISGFAILLFVGIAQLERNVTGPLGISYLDRTRRLEVFRFQLYEAVVHREFATVQGTDIRKHLLFFDLRSVRLETFIESGKRRIHIFQGRNTVAEQRVVVLHQAVAVITDDLLEQVFFFEAKPVLDAFGIVIRIRPEAPRESTVIQAVLDFFGTLFKSDDSLVLVSLVGHRIPFVGILRAHQITESPFLTDGENLLERRVLLIVGVLRLRSHHFKGLFHAENTGAGTVIATGHQGRRRHQGKGAQDSGINKVLDHILSISKIRFHP